MNKRIPVIHESADDLKHRLSHERHPGKRQRLHALYLLATGQARFRADLAELLAVDRNTIGRWLARYAHGGLDALLDLYIPPGKAPALQPDQLAQLQDALQQPQGFASYDAVRQWIHDAFGVTLSYKATHKLVRYKLGAKLKVARPTHEKKR
jgi:transposase